MAGAAGKARHGMSHPHSIAGGAAVGTFGHPGILSGGADPSCPSAALGMEPHSRALT